MTSISDQARRYIAFSGGVESSAMCILYGKDATPIFTDTGWEHKPMYERLDMMERALKIIHGENFKIIRIRPENIDGTGTNTLPDYIRLRKFYPNSMARFCTRLGKIEPMDKFLSQQGPCEVMIGLNADEAEDRVGNYGKCKNVTYTYPLVDDDYARIDCENLLDEYGLKPNFRPYMARGGCIGCFFKRKREYSAMALLAKDEALSVADLEESIQDKRGNYYHLHSGIPNMRKFIENESHSLIPASEMYSESEPEGKGCGVFCHR
jgi:3'-phosphoadenosine 5'-phosphosulfate sulfotransferase (PAPS reductase)/FAD synthetase